MANVAVRRGRRLPLDSSDNATRRRLEGAAAIGPQVDAGYETPRRSGFTRTKADSFEQSKTCLSVSVKQSPRNAYQLTLLAELHNDNFYSASALLAMQSAVLARGIPSVRPSVRPSVLPSRSGIVSR